MNRRTLLLLAGASIGSAGCVRSLGDGASAEGTRTQDSTPEPDSREDSPGTPTQSDDCQRTEKEPNCESIDSGRRSATFGRHAVEISSVEFPDTDRLAADLSFRDRDDGSPPVLRATVKNTTGCGLRVGFGGEPPFTAAVAYSPNRESGLMLVPVSGNVGKSDENGDGEFTVVPESKTNGCWTVPDTVVSSDELVIRQLEPCESLSSDYYLVGHSPDDTCIPKRTYEFSALVQLNGKSNQNFRWNGNIRIS